jgi:hypothetical protein
LWLYQQTLNEPTNLIPQVSNTLKKAVKERTKIDWDYWFKGQLSMEWRTKYNHALTITNHRIRNQAAEKWSRKIIDRTWYFVLASWTICKEIDHSVEEDQLHNQKDRLVAKIMRNKEKKKHLPSSYLNNIAEEDIWDSSLGSLTMMDSQIQFSKQASSRSPTPLIA